MERARVMMAMAVKPGAFTSCRSANLKSWIMGLAVGCGDPGVWIQNLFTHRRHRGHRAFVEFSSRCVLCALCGDFEVEDRGGLRDALRRLELDLARDQGRPPGSAADLLRGASFR